MGAIALDWIAMVSVSAKPAPRPYVDFASVPPSQWRMHDRLENWARWARGSQRQSGATGSPMFSLYRSSDMRSRSYGEETSVPIDRDDAVRIAKGMAHLPDKHRRALQWCYLRPGNPSGQARELAVTLEGLRDLVKDARFMLINRGV